MYRGLDDNAPPAAGSPSLEAMPSAEHAPWRLSFLGLLRQLAAHRPDLPPIGHASRPQDEHFRIGQLASLTFAPREIAQLRQVQDKLKIQLFGLGMLGPNGALPLHFTEIVREGAMLGEMVPDRQHKFRLVIGPLNLQQYLNFTPNGRDFPVLIEWVRSFVGYEFVWEVELQVIPDAAPPAVLGSSERLGWSTWLGEPDRSRAITGMVFEPEQYAKH